MFNCKLIVTQLQYQMITMNMIANKSPFDSKFIIPNGYRPEVNH